MAELQQAYAQPQKSKASANVSNPAPAPPRAAIQSVEPVQTSELERPCEKGRDIRKSDLCAQWKAADAARDAADYAWWALAIGALGTVGLFITLYYTRAAVRAAQESTKDAGKALAIAERNAQAAADQVRLTQDAQRAWLDFEIDEPAIRVSAGNPLPDEGISALLKARVKNYGNTPATDVYVVGAMRLHGIFFKLPDLSDDLARECAKLEDIPNRVGARAFRDSPVTVEGHTTISQDLLSTFIEISGSEAWITLAVRVSYLSSGMRKHADNYYRLAGPLRGLGNAQAPFDLNLSVQPQSLVAIPGGTIT